METTSHTSLFGPGELIVDRYEVIKVLGTGGMGIVVSVIDHALDNEIVAIKLLFPHMAKDEVQFGRFRNEVLITRKLAHPNIVRLYDFGAAGHGYYFISMEHVGGGNLGQKIYGMREEKLDFQEVLRIMFEISQGLSCAHRKGVIHRDLKPDNVLLTEDGEVKLTDFGLARSMLVDKGFTATGETVGTPFYMAPEQLSGHKVDGRADIYSLGIVAFEMSVGRRPFLDENYLNLVAKHFREPIPDFASKESGIPDWFQTFVQKCAAKRQEDRFQDADEVAEVLYKHMSKADRKAAGAHPAVFSANSKGATSGPIKQLVLKYMLWMLSGCLFALAIAAILYFLPDFAASIGEFFFSASSSRAVPL